MAVRLGHDSYYVFWLNGMAGTGKTTVMETFCSLLNEKGLLGASFFCSIRSKTPRRDVYAVFPSIEKTLAGNHPHFRENLVQVLPHVQILLGWISKISTTHSSSVLRRRHSAKDEVIVVCIDALDECEDQEGTAMLLNAVLDRQRNVSLRFFVTSRPEWRIREAFVQQHYLSLRLHVIEDHVVQADIAVYLSDRLQ